MYYANYNTRCVNSWEQNNKQNGWPKIDTTNPTIVSGLMSNGDIQQPGFFHFPICNVTNISDCGKNSYQ
jgi:hypothetical protein